MKMNKQKIERLIARIVDLEYDQLDKALHSNHIGRDQWNEAAKEIEKWERETRKEFGLDDDGHLEEEYQRHQQAMMDR